MRFRDSSFIFALKRQRITYFAGASPTQTVTPTFCNIFILLSVQAHAVQPNTAQTQKNFIRVKKKTKFTNYVILNFGEMFEMMHKTVRIFGTWVGICHSV